MQGRSYVTARAPRADPHSDPGRAPGRVGPVSESEALSAARGPSEPGPGRAAAPGCRAGCGQGARAANVKAYEHPARAGPGRALAMTDSQAEDLFVTVHRRDVSP